MQNGMYQRAIERVIGMQTKQWTDAGFEIWHAAGKVDDLTHRIADDSRRMAERFTSFARDIEAHQPGWDPTGYSTIRDIAVNVALLGAAKENFRTLLRTNLGKEALAAFTTAFSDIIDEDGELFG